MAASSALQSCMGRMASPVPRLGSRTASTTLLSSVILPRRHLVRCQVQDGNGEQPTTPSTPPRVPKVSTKFADVLAFGGPAPERINGRLAMLGFVSAVAVEAASGNDLVSQLSAGGLPWFLYASALFSLASLVPMFQGVSAESKSDGVMTSKAELWNGRAAMLGLVAMAVTEYLKGGPIV